MAQNKRTVSRPSFAFPFFPTALKACAARIDRDDDFDEGVSVFLHDFVPGSEPPSIEVLLRLDLRDLALQSGLAPGDVRAALVVRSDELRRRTVLAEFTPDEVPGTWAGPIPIDVFGLSRVEVDLVCYLDAQLGHSFERAWRRGSVFAQRSWSVVSPRYSSLFTVTWEHFSGYEAWQKDALWRVDFPEGERFHEVSSESAVVVTLNADHTGLHSLLELPGTTPAARATKAIVTKMIFSEILSTIVNSVVADFRRFATEEGVRFEDLEDDRLTTRVLHFLQDAGVSEADLINGRLSDHAAVSHFVQGTISLGQAFDLAAWERISR